MINEKTILDALNGYYKREGLDDCPESLKEAMGSDGLISLAYTEYEDGFHPYRIIQVSYDPENQRYVYDLAFDDMDRTLCEPCPVDVFVDNLLYCAFDDFLDIGNATEN